MDRTFIILKKWPQGFICPFTMAIFHNIQKCILDIIGNIQQISGERLQDYWSSGFNVCIIISTLHFAAKSKT